MGEENNKPFRVFTIDDKGNRYELGTIMTGQGFTIDNTATTNTTGRYNMGFDACVCEAPKKDAPDAMVNYLAKSGRTYSNGFWNDFFNNYVGDNNHNVHDFLHRMQSGTSGWDSTVTVDSLGSMKGLQETYSQYFNTENK